MGFDEIGGEFLAALIAFVGSAAMYFLQKNAERRSVNIAVMAEVQRLLTVLESHLAFRRKCAESGRQVPLIPFTTEVYKSQIAHVGVIYGDVVADVVSFYGYIDFLNTLQAMKSEYEKKDDLEGFYQTYDSTLNTVVEGFSDRFK